MIYLFFFLEVGSCFYFVCFCEVGGGGVLFGEVDVAVVGGGELLAFALCFSFLEAGGGGGGGGAMYSLSVFFCFFL